MKLRKLIKEKYNEDIDFKKLNQNIQDRIKEICRIYEQEIPTHIDKINNINETIYMFRLKAYGVYNDTNKNNSPNNGLIAFFRTKLEAQDCKNILSKAVSCNMYDASDKQEIENKEGFCKFFISWSEIDIMLYE